jgi:hypothetical protein
MADPKLKLRLQFNITKDEWKDLREEIRKRVEQRNYMTEIMAVLVTTLIGAAATTQNYLFIGIVPFIACFFMFLIRASYNRHRCLINYIKTIEQKMNEIVNALYADKPAEDKTKNANEITFWETTFKETSQTNRRAAYNCFNVGTFLFCGFVFSICGGQALFEYLENISPQLGIFLGILLIGIFWVAGAVAVYCSYIKINDLYNVIDYAELKLQNEESVIGVIAYHQLMIRLLRLLWLKTVKELITAKSKNNENQKGKRILVVTSKRSFFVYRNTKNECCPINEEVPPALKEAPEIIKVLQVLY